MLTIDKDKRMACPGNSLIMRWRVLRASVKVTRRAQVAALATFLAPFATPAFGQVVNYYSGTDSAGYEVEVYTTAGPQGEVIYGFGLTGDSFCNGVQTPGAILGGNTDGSVYYPIIDNRATFSELRPDFFISADIRFIGGDKIEGSSVYEQATYTGSSFPPTNADTSACTTRELTFIATYVGSLAMSAVPSTFSAHAGRR